jgi:hypothetical protein
MSEGKEHEAMAKNLPDEKILFRIEPEKEEECHKGRCADAHRDGHCGGKEYGEKCLLAERFREYRDQK